MYDNARNVALRENKVFLAAQEHPNDPEIHRQIEIPARKAGRMKRDLLSALRERLFGKASEQWDRDLEDFMRRNRNWQDLSPRGIKTRAAILELQDYKGKQLHAHQS
jgi:hypothetical protein